MALESTTGSAPIEPGYIPPGPPERVRRAAREEGVVHTVRRSAAWAARFAAGPAVARRVRGTPSFTFAGERYPYTDAWHSWTWLNERAVELPIAARALDQADPARTLEVGNVLSHYRPAPHTIVDKYETAPGVRNVDLFDMPVTEQYDLVLCVSTLEHVGWDESPRDPAVAPRAVDHLRRLVAPGGRLLVTVPVGYHPLLDAAIRDGALGFDEVRALRCRYPSMIWREVDPADVADATYDLLIYRAEAVLVASWVNPQAPPAP